MIGWIILALLAIGFVFLFMAAQVDDVGRSASERADGMFLAVVGGLFIATAILILVGAGIWSLM